MTNRVYSYEIVVELALEDKIGEEIDGKFVPH
jgi:hypothetical protein